MDPRRGQPDPFRIYFSRTTGHARRAVSWGATQPNIVARVAASLLIIVLGLTVLVVMIPLLLLAALALILFSFYLRLRYWWASRKKQNETTEGRENVRVIRRD